MLRLKCKVDITQRPTPVYTNRSSSMSFDFINELEVNSTWEHLTDTAKLKTPYKIFFLKDGARFTLEGRNITAGIDTVPIILRGDKIKISLGYVYYNAANEEIIDMNTVFEGFISGVSSSTPIEISIEDNMYLLKQIAVPSKLYKTKDYTVESMLKLWLKGSGLTVKDTNQNAILSTKIGDIRAQNETVAQLLDRFKKDYRLQSYFRGNEIRCGAVVYWPEDSKQHVFKFNYNIIDHELTYKRVDDINIGILVHSFIKLPSKRHNKDGSEKIKTKRINYFAYYLNGKLKLLDHKPNNFEGEIRTLNFFGETQEQIKADIVKHLNRLNYDGFRGHFTTFGLPYVKHGDSVKIINNNMPEYNGTYMVKGVETSFGINGFRQKIHIDIKIDNVSTSEISTGL